MKSWQVLLCAIPGLYGVLTCVCFFFYARVLGIEPMNARTGEYLYSYAKGNIPINRLPRTECNRAKVRVELKGAL